MRKFEASCSKLMKKLSLLFLHLKYYYINYYNKYIMMDNTTFIIIIYSEKHNNYNKNRKNKRNYVLATADHDDGGQIASLHICCLRLQL